MNLNKKAGIEPDYSDAMEQMEKHARHEGIGQSRIPKVAVGADGEVQKDDAPAKDVPDQTRHEKVTRPVQEAQVNVAPANPDPVVKTPVEAEAVKAGEPDTEDADDNIIKDDPYIEKIPASYGDLPKTAPIPKDDDNPDIGRADGPAENSISYMSPEQFEARRLALSQGQPEKDIPSWIVKPDIWPPFIEFPSKKDLANIKAAEVAGELTDERMAAFNEHFQRLSVLMQLRSEQLDQWIRDENAFLDRNRVKKLTPWSSHVRKNMKALERERKQLGDNLDRDPFHDIKWAVLLDPYASSDDPRFAAVARWGHNSLETSDGGVLVATDDDIYIPRGSTGTEGSAQQAVLEAVERGWTTISIAGNKEFAMKAAAEAQKYGLGAEITIHHGFSLSSKTQYIMPNPPKLEQARNEASKAKLAHQALMAGEGQAPSSDKEGADNKSSEPSAEPVDVGKPFDGEESKKKQDPDEDHEDTPTPGR